MRTAYLSTASVILLTSLLAGASGAADGKVSNGVYVNAFFGMSYPLPQGFYEVHQPGTARVGPANLLLIADRHTGALLRERLLISADKAAAYSWGAKRYVKKFSHAISSQPGVKFVTRPRDLCWRARFLSSKLESERFWYGAVQGVPEHTGKRILFELDIRCGI